MREILKQIVDDLARQFDTELDCNADFGSELRRISTTALNRFLGQRGYTSPDQAATVDDQIHYAAGQIITALEGKMDLNVPPDVDQTGRIRRIRAAVHAVRTDPDREVDHPAASHWADEAMLALRILGYRGGYMAINPTLDRIAETVARLQEDVQSRIFRPVGSRRCIVQIGTPIDLRERLEPFQAQARETIADLTRDCEAAVQGGINSINASNEAPGAALF